MAVVQADDQTRPASPTPTPASPLARRASTSAGVDFRWNNISYTIDVGAKKGGVKQILSDCCGCAKSGELWAIIGASGAGKSSLLNVLAGRTRHGGAHQIGGGISINGTPIDPVRYRDRIAYVMQQDALTATATPRECFHFSAALRLPAKEGSDAGARTARVERLLASLSLAKCADTFVGSPMIRGVSGGEKKRTAIGVEIVTDPSLLFLDEPTSGLDSYAAYNVVQILRKLAAGGCAVLCTIHQPSSEVFHLFDNVVVLAHGRVAYCGPVPAMGPHYAALGHPCPANYNPADHVMYILQTTSEADLLESFNLGKPGCYADQGLLQNGNGNGNGNGQGNGDGDEAKSGGGGAGGGKGAAAATGAAAAADADDTGTESRVSGFWTQTRWLMRREFRALVRDKASLGARFGMTAFLNLLFGLIFKGAGAANPSDLVGLQTHFGALVQVCIGSMFGSAQPTILTFPLEAPIYLREYAAGAYGAVPYFLSKMIVELPLTFAQNMLLGVITYFLMEFQGNFLWLVCIFWLNGFFAASVALLLGSAASNTKVAMELAPLLFVPQMLFSGFFIRMDQIPEYMRWGQYLCGLKYSINLLMGVEFGACYDEQKAASFTWIDLSGQAAPTTKTCATLSADAVSIASECTCYQLFEQNDVEWDNWYVSFGVLIALVVVFRVAALITLSWRAKKASTH